MYLELSSADSWWGREIERAGFGGGGFGEVGDGGCPVGDYALTCCGKLKKKKKKCVCVGGGGGGGKGGRGGFKKKTKKKKERERTRTRKLHFTRIVV